MRLEPPHTSNSFLSGLLIGAVLILSAGCGRPAPSNEVTKASVVENNTIGASARVAYVDPDTGQLTYKKPRTRSGRDPLELDAAFVESIRSSHEKVIIRELVDGTMLATKPGGFRAAAVATIDADGNLQTTHISADSSEVEGSSDEQ